jgi:hypothetical protein
MPSVPEAAVAEAADDELLTDRLRLLGAKK